MIPTLEIGYFTVVVWKSIVKFNGVLSKRGGEREGNTVTILAQTPHRRRQDTVLIPERFVPVHFTVSFD